MIQTSELPLTVNGAAVPDASVDEMCTADLNGDLAQQLGETGYLLLRDVHDPVEVDAARREVLRRLAEVGEVSDPVESGQASGVSRRREIYPTTEDLGAFWRSVSEGAAVRSVITDRA